MSLLITQTPNLVDLSKYSVVFCDSLEALEWAYQNGLRDSAVIKSSSPAMLLDSKKNIYNVESRWSIDELEKFQRTIQKLTKDVFDAALGVVGVKREVALAVSMLTYQFQKLLYKAACLEDDDFTNSRLFIYVEGKTGPAGNMMNSPWDQLLLDNSAFSVVSYTLKNDKWKILTTQGVSYWKRFKVAGFETIIYRLAMKLMKKIPDRVFKRKILMPNENELNIEIASSLVMHGVKISEIKLNPVPDINTIKLDKNIALLYEVIFPIVLKRVERWVVPSAVEITMKMFNSQLEERLKYFKLLVNGWEEVITKDDRIKQAVLANCPGNIRGQTLSYVCNKRNIPFISSQHGVTIEISKWHNMVHIGFDNSVSDVVFSYNSKAVDISKSTYFDKSKYYVVGMPYRFIRMKYSQIINRSISPIVYISTNLYHMGFNLSQKTDYGNAIDEQRIIVDVLSQLPHKICYKTYPEDNRRYADSDPVLKDIEASDNIELYSDKIDMRYLVSRYRVLLTSQATSTIGWLIMSRKPVIFINKKNDSPLTEDAYQRLSQGIFVFNDDDSNFYKILRDFLSQSIDQIEELWKNKKHAREEMVKNYFSQYEGGAGARAAKIIVKEYLN